MSYTAENHTVFSDRIKALAVGFQNLLDEGERLDQIYINETGSGSDPDYIDTSNGTAAEHTDIITFYRAYRDFVDGSADPPQLDRRPNLSPFLQ